MKDRDLYRIFTNTLTCEGQELCYRMGEQETRSYYEKKKDSIGLENLVLLQEVEAETQLGIFTTRAKQFINKSYAERLTKLFPQANFDNINRDAYSLSFTYQGQNFELIPAGVETTMSFTDGTGELRNFTVKLYGSEMWGASGVELLTGDVDRSALISLLDQALKMKDVLSRLYNDSRLYNFSPNLEVYSLSGDQVYLGAIRPRGEDEPVTSYETDEEGNSVPSDVMDVFLYVNINAADDADLVAKEEADFSKINSPQD
jgi:hypothetical protein